MQLVLAAGDSDCRCLLTGSKRSSMAGMCPGSKFSRNFVAGSIEHVVHAKSVGDDGHR